MDDFPFVLMASAVCDVEMDFRIFWWLIKMINVCNSLSSVARAGYC